MYINIKEIEACTDIPECMETEERIDVTLEDGHLSALAELILHSWPSTKGEIHYGHSKMK